MKIRAALAGVVLALTLSGVALAATALHQTPPLSAGDYLDPAACADTVVPDGKVLWHFVLTQTEANEAMLTVTFGYPLYEKAVLSSKNSGGVLHFNVLSDIGDVVVAATATADGDLLNLSHTCYTEAQPSTPPSAEPSTSPEPSSSPTATPSSQPSDTPTPTPSSEPSSMPTSAPSDSPTASESTPPTAPTVLPATDTADQPSETRQMAGQLAFVCVIALAAFLLGEHSGRRQK